MSNKQPICITGLPRSMTAWCAAYFGIWHDLSIKTTVPDMLEKIGASGDSDSGLLFHFEKVCEKYPDAKWVCLVRHPLECWRSLKNLNLSFDPCTLREAFEKTCHAMECFSHSVPCFSVDIDRQELAKFETMRELHKYLDVPFDENRFRIFRDLRINTRILCQPQLSPQ